MKKLIVAGLTAAVLTPTAAFAGPSTDAALGLGAFAVFNQMLGGVGIFQRYQAPPVVVAAPAPPIVVAPPPPPPPVVYQYYPPAPVYAYPGPVYVTPGPAYYAPAPVVIYRQRGRHWRHGDDD
jgi:hypothetical protein